jgi:periplasmic copper chaperone A
LNPIMSSKFAIQFVAACAISMLATASFSHVTLQDPVAAAGTGYRAVLRVGHGCAGSPTTAITVTVPPGFNGAQPLVKAGWTAAVRTGPLAVPYEAHGTQFTEGVLEISWTAKTAADALPDTFYDEFVLRGTTPKAPGPLWFKVVQTCEKGSTAWVEVPAHGTHAHDLKAPAALLEVIDVQAAGEHAH